MGNVQSNIAIDFFESLNYNLTEVSNKYVNTTAQTCSSTVTSKFIICPTYHQVGTLYGNLNSDAKSYCELSAKDTAEIRNNFTTEVQTAIKKSLDQASANKQAFLALALSVQSNVIDSRTKLENYLITKINNNVTQTCVQNVTASNSDEVVLCGTIYGDVHMNRILNANSYGIANCEYAAFFDAVKNDKILQDFDTTLKQREDSEQAGISQLTTPIIIVIAVVAGLVVLVIVIIVIVVIVRKLKKKKALTASGVTGTTATSTGTMSKLTSVANQLLDKK